MSRISLFLRTLPVALLVGAAACGLSAQAQTQSGAHEGATTSSDGGVVQGIEKTTKKAANATKRTAKKVGNATSKAASRASGAVRRTGEKIGKKLPKGHEAPPVDEQGRPGNKAS
ncbi:MAG: hypothetical protein ABI135_01485 [Rhodoferax sp.]